MIYSVGRILAGIKEHSLNVLTREASRMPRYIEQTQRLTIIMHVRERYGNSLVGRVIWC